MSSKIKEQNTNPEMLSEKLLWLTRSMLEGAGAANWDKMSKMEMQRQALLRDLNHAVSASYGEYSAEFVRANMEEALTLNNRIVELGLKAKAELAEIMGNIRRGRKAMNVYYGIK